MARASVLVLSVAEGPAIISAAFPVGRARTSRGRGGGDMCQRSAARSVSRLLKLCQCLSGLRGAEANSLLVGRARLGVASEVV